MDPAGYRTWHIIHTGTLRCMPTVLTFSDKNKHVMQILILADLGFINRNAFWLYK